MKTTPIGIDLAKNMFQVQGVNVQGKTVLSKQLKRDQMATFLANLPPCLIGMEACGSAHYCARKLQGLVPRQHSTGGKSNLLSISKRCDTYLRTLLIHGARAVIRHAERKLDGQAWVSKLLGRRNKNVAAVALSNRNARIVWALLAHEREFQSDYAGAGA